MSLPHLPDEAEVREALRHLRSEAASFFPTLARVLRQPIRLPRNLYEQRIGGNDQHSAEVVTGPFYFCIYNVFLFSFALRLLVYVVGVDEPFFKDLLYGVHLRVVYDFFSMVQSWIDVLPLSLIVDARIAFAALVFLLILLATTFFARFFFSSGFKWRSMYLSLTYLLSLALALTLVQYSMAQFSFRAAGPNKLLFLVLIFGTAASGGLAKYLFPFLVMWPEARRRWVQKLLFAGFYWGIILVCTVAFANAPIVYGWVKLYEVQRLLNTGMANLESGELDRAETMFERAIAVDQTDYWAAEGHFRLMRVHATRILRDLETTSAESGLESATLDRLTLRALSGDAIPDHRRRFPSLSDVLMKEAETATGELSFYREAFIDFERRRGLPVTSSQVDVVLQDLREREGLDDEEEFQNSLRESRVYLVSVRRSIRRQIFDGWLLDDEPKRGDIQESYDWVRRLPLKLELLWWRFKATNLRREAETLEYLDLMDRYYITDKKALIEANRQIIDQELLFPYVRLPDDQLAQLSARRVGGLFRKAYLNYLKSELDDLEGSPVSAYSAILTNHIADFRKQLDWAAADPLYQDTPPLDDQFEQWSR